MWRSREWNPYGCRVLPKLHLWLDSVHSFTTPCDTFLDFWPWGLSWWVSSGWGSDWWFGDRWVGFLSGRGDTWFGVEKISDGPDGGPIKIPIIFIFISFGPSSSDKILYDNFLIKISSPLKFFWIHQYIYNLCSNYHSYPTISKLFLINFHQNLFNFTMGNITGPMLTIWINW